MMERLEKELNNKQLEGVLQTEGAVLVLAGAGSGKTRLLTFKIAYILDKMGIVPSTVMGVTFTNKAACEMKDRVERLVQGGAPWLGTFHHLSGRILRQEAELVGLAPNYSIYDREDSKRLIKDIMEDMGINHKQLLPKAVLDEISRLKNELISPQDVPPHTGGYRMPFLSELYETYQDTLKHNNAVDFDDMLVLAVRLLRGDGEARTRWSNRFQYILVDEFQDTNYVQYELVKMLAEGGGNITVVGDDDQSIYGWRGARVRNILDFPKDYPGCSIIRLEQNYRSTQRILSVANSVVLNNPDRHPKTLWTSRSKGVLVDVREFGDAHQEARFVAGEIADTVAKGNTRGGNIAILYRANYLSRLFEEELRVRGLPYEVVGGLKFYDRAEIKDIIAYLRLVHNPHDDIAFKRVVNIPRRGIGISSQHRLIEYARSSNLSLYDASSSPPDTISASATRGLASFVELIEKLRSIADDALVVDIMRELLVSSGYITMLADDAPIKLDENFAALLDSMRGSISIDNRARLENIGQLVNSAAQFVEEYPENPSLAAYLEMTSLLTDVDVWHESEDTITLMTVHSAKGLEFDWVYIVGLEDGLFPIVRERGDVDIQEERRLMYVALTRARERVVVSYAKTRSRFGRTEPQLPSRFIAEFPDKDTSFRSFVSPSSKTRSDVILSPQDRYRKSSYRKGQRVLHQFFGRGIIRDVRGSGERTVLVVHFNEAGEKKLVASYAKLKIIG